MNNTFLALVMVAVIYAIGEGVWLSSMSGFYARQLKDVIHKTTMPISIQSIPAVVLVYPLLFTGFYYFVLSTYNDISAMALSGFIFGAVVYGVFNLSNKSIFPGYTWNMTIVDTAWGSLWFATIAAIFYVIRRQG